MNRFPRLFLALLVLIGIGFPIQERELEPMDWGPIMPFPADDPPDRHDNPQARAQWEYQRLRNPETGLIPKGIFRREHEFARKLPQRPDGEKVAGWVNRGPYNVGGRTRALGIDVTDPTGQTLLAGGVTGGLWRTVDDGASWTMLVGSSHLHHINCIAQDIRPGQENVWYYGTGEGQKTNLDSGQRYHRGDGIFKSIDGGLTWDVLPATATYLPQEFDNPFNYVGRIVVDVSNTLEDEVYAATYGIIYRSIDGGESWTPVLGDEDQLGKYTEITIDDQGVLFASISSDGGTNGVFRSPDGVNWADLGAALLQSGIRPHCPGGLANLCGPGLCSGRQPNQFSHQRTLELFLLFRRRVGQWRGLD